MPVIVLMDKETSDDRVAVREWFENSRFATCEAADVFEALEGLSDFTTDSRPDVVLLEVESCEEDFQLIQDTIEPSSGVDQMPIFALSSNPANFRSTTDRGCFRGSLGQVAIHLDKLIPDSSISQKHQTSA